MYCANDWKIAYKFIALIEFLIRSVFLSHGEEVYYLFQLVSTLQVPAIHEGRLVFSAFWFLTIICEYKNFTFHFLTRISEFDNFAVLPLVRISTNDTNSGEKQKGKYVTIIPFLLIYYDGCMVFGSSK